MVFDDTNMRSVLELFTKQNFQKKKSSFFTILYSVSEEITLFSSTVTCSLMTELLLTIDITCAPCDFKPNYDGIQLSNVKLNRVLFHCNW